MDQIKRAFTTSWFAPYGRILRWGIDTMIPVMGRADISDIPNDLVALVSVRFAREVISDR